MAHLLYRAICFSMHNSVQDPSPISLTIATRGSLPYFPCDTLSTMPSKFSSNFPYVLVNSQMAFHLVIVIFDQLTQLYFQYLRLSGPTARPPLLRYRVSLCLSHLWFSGIARYRAVPPKTALSQRRGEGGRGYRSSSCPLEGIAIRGYR